MSMIGKRDTEGLDPPVNEAPSTRRASARMRAPVDIGEQIQRTARLQEALLDCLEDEAKAFLAAKPGGVGSLLPKGFEGRLREAADTLNALTLAHSRYTKSEDEWASRLTPDQKFEHLGMFALSQYKERPDYVANWVENLVMSLNHAGDTTRILATKRVNARLTVDEVQDREV